MGESMGRDEASPIIGSHLFEEKWWRNFCTERGPSTPKTRNLSASDTPPEKGTQKGKNAAKLQENNCL